MRHFPRQLRSRERGGGGGAEGCWIIPTEKKKVKQGECGAFPGAGGGGEGGGGGGHRKDVGNSELGEFPPLKGEERLGNTSGRK